jgi:hypothetical protein
MGGSGGEHMLEGAVASRRSAGRDCPGLRARAAGRPWAGCAHAGCCVVVAAGWLLQCGSVAAMRSCWLAGCGCGGGCWLSLAVGCALAVGGVRGVSSVGGVWHTAARTWIYSNTGVTPDFGVHFHKMNL